MSYDYDSRHEALLLRTLRQMPSTFTSHRFTRAAEANGCPPRTDKHNSGPHTFLHKHADIAFRGSRTWVKRPIAKAPQLPDVLRSELESIKTELENLKAEGNNSRSPKRIAPPAPAPAPPPAPAPERPRAKGLNTRAESTDKHNLTGFAIGLLLGFLVMLLANIILHLI